jgi:hypothetical protein
MIGTKCRTLFGFEEKPHGSIDDIVGLKNYVSNLESDMQEYSSLRKVVPKTVKKDTDLLYNRAKKYISDYYKSVTVELKKVKKKFKRIHCEYKNLLELTSDVFDFEEQLEYLAADYQRLNIVAKKKLKVKQIEQFIEKIYYQYKLGIQQNPRVSKKSSILENSPATKLVAAGLMVSAVGISAVILYKFFSF